MEGVTETKFGTMVAYGVRMMPDCRIHACAEKAWDTSTTLGDEKYNWRNIGAGCVDKDMHCSDSAL